MPSACGGVGTAMKTIWLMIDAILDRVGEAQAFGGDVAMDEFLEARLVDRDLARLQHVDFALVVIDADDVVADFREAGAARRDRRIRSR